MVKIRIVILFLLPILLFSCSEKPNWKEKHQILEKFETIEINSSFEIFLIQDTLYSVRIVADEDVVGNVEIKNEAGKLKISNKSTWKWLRPTTNKIKLYISGDKPSFLYVNETCKIETINPIISEKFGLIMASKLNEANVTLQCSVFHFFNNHPMGGKITLSGTTDRLKVWPTALVQIDARNLQTTVALVENSSKGDVHVRCSETLVYKISNTGNIYYYGMPNKFDFQGDNGNGELIHAE